MNNNIILIKLKKKLKVLSSKNKNTKHSIKEILNEAEKIKHIVFLIITNKLIVNHKITQINKFLIT